VRYAANIAGMQHIAAIADFPMDTYDFMHDLMLRSPFLLSKHVIPHVEATDDGASAPSATCPRYTATTRHRTNRHTSPENTV